MSLLLLLAGDCGLTYMMSSATATKETSSQDVEMKDVEKTDAGEEVKKDPDILTLEGMLSLKLFVVFISHDFMVCQITKYVDKLVLSYNYKIIYFLCIV